MTTAAEILLIPTPRHVRRADGWTPIPQWLTPEVVAGLMANVESAAKSLSHFDRAHLWDGVLSLSITPGWCGASPLEAAGYTLSVTDSLPITLSSPTIAGLRHGLATLVQLLRQFPGALPRLVIIDSPSFATRGVMIDVSRDRIPTMATFREIIDNLALLKINHLQVYTEHTFAYAGHDEVWQGWSPITPAEARDLDDYAHARGIELAANQNCFGHLRQWLGHEKYALLAETHGEWMFDVWKRTGPFSLCPADPKCLDLVRDLLGQLTPCFRSPLVNIGCDETYDVGFGRSRAEVDQRGRAAVCLEFVSKINDIVRGLGKRSLFWADIALSHPELLSRIPADMTALAWGYEPSSPFDDWAGRLGSLADGPSRAWLCPGTSSWRSFAGRTKERRGNIAAAAAAGLKHQVAGLLTCDWGDTGHWQQWPISMLGIAHGAHASWHAERAKDVETRAVSLHALHDPSTTAAAWLERLGDADLPLRETCLGLAKAGEHGRLLNQGALFIDLFKKLDEMRDIGDVAQWSQALERVSQLAQSRPATGNARLDRELAHTAAFVEFAAKRAAGRRGANTPEVVGLSTDLGSIRREHEALWHETSRPGGLADSMSHFDAIEMPPKCV
jgi:hexosaminidase